MDHNDLFKHDFIVWLEIIEYKEQNRIDKTITNYPLVNLKLSTKIGIVFFVYPLMAKGIFLSFSPFFFQKLSFNSLIITLHYCLQFFFLRLDYDVLGPRPIHPQWVPCAMPALISIAQRNEQQ